MACRTQLSLTPARCQTKRVREVGHLFHVRKFLPVDHRVAVRIVVRVVLRAVASALLPHVIQSSVVVSQLRQRRWLAVDCAQCCVSEAFERELHELLGYSALVLVPITPCSAAACWSRAQSALAPHTGRALHASSSCANPHVVFAGAWGGARSCVCALDEVSRAPYSPSAGSVLAHCRWQLPSHNQRRPQAASSTARAASCRTIPSLRRAVLPCSGGGILTLAGPGVQPYCTHCPLPLWDGRGRRGGARRARGYTSNERDSSRC
eukprot:COSAG02_NODE_566_length_20219_cov_13.531759_12_plen_264_part_00